MEPPYSRQTWNIYSGTSLFQTNLEYLQWNFLIPDKTWNIYSGTSLFQTNMEYLQWNLLIPDKLGIFTVEPPYSRQTWNIYSGTSLFQTNMEYLQWNLLIPDKTWNIYSGTSSFQTNLEQEKCSLIERFPHFRGQNVHNPNIKESRNSPYFRGIISGKSI